MDNLKSEWKTAHREKGYINAEGQVVTSTKFIEDGAICESNWFKLPKEKRVLFIAREARNDDGDQFWFKEIINHTDNSDDGSNARKYIRYIGHIYDCLLNQNGEANTIKPEKDDDLYKEMLKNIAYMNLNKLGGVESRMGKESIKFLDDYVERYSGFILREIDILNPEYIVCLGKGKKWTGKHVEYCLQNEKYSVINQSEYMKKNIIFNNITDSVDLDVKYKLINCYHPSYSDIYSDLENCFKKHTSFIINR